MKQIRYKSIKPQKKLAHRYVCILVLNNGKTRSKYFDVINMPVTTWPTRSKKLDNHIGMWKVKTSYISLIC